MAYFEQGRRPITTRVIDCYERHLGVKVELDPIATVEYVGRADVDCRSFIRGAAYTAGFSALALVGGDHLARMRSPGVPPKAGEPMSTGEGDPLLRLLQDHYGHTWRISRTQSLWIAIAWDPKPHTPPQWYTTTSTNSSPN